MKSLAICNQTALSVRLVVNCSQFSKSHWILKIARPKCVSGHSEKLDPPPPFNPFPLSLVLCRFGLIHFTTGPPPPFHGKILLDLDSTNPKEQKVERNPWSKTRLSGPRFLPAFYRSPSDYVI